MPQHTVQLGDALSAFKTAVAALTYPTSSDPVFPTTALLMPGQEFKTNRIYPQAIIRVSGGDLDDENGRTNHRFNISVEMRVKREATVDGESIVYGEGRTSDQAMGAGLADMLAKLVSGSGHVTPQDNAELLSYFNYTGFTSLPQTEQHFAWNANFTAALNLT